MTFQPGAMLYTQGFGSRPENVEVPHYDTRAPSSTDVLYPIGKEWIYIGQSIWKLLSLTSIAGVMTANWVQLADSDGAVQAVLGTASQITATNNAGTVTLSLPSAIITPGSLTTTTTLTAGTGLTVTSGGAAITGTTTINTSGSAVTTIGTGGTGAVNIGNATGNTSVTGSLTSSTGLVATTGDITASAGNINTTLGSMSAGTTVTAGTGITATTGNIAASSGNVSASGTVTGGTGLIATTGNITASAVSSGLVLTPTVVASGASPQTANGRVGQVTFSGVSIASGATQSFVINNTSIAAIGTVILYGMTGVTAGAALSIVSVTNVAATSSTIVVTNGTSATMVTSTADITFTFLVLN